MLRQALVFVLGVAIAACTHGEERVDRCARLEKDFDRCVGSSLVSFDCQSTSDATLDRIEALTTSGGCALFAEALPMDGDLQSATCRLMGVGCVAASNAAPERAPTKYPIVLVNGFDTSPLFRYSDRIVTTLREQGGHTVFLATLPPYDAPARRARVLWDRVKDALVKTQLPRVNLVCHSLGGLDCRYLASPAGLAMDLSDPSIVSRVASVTTIGTAHRGTRVADLLLGALPDGDRGKTINDFATLVGDWFSDSALRDDVHLRESLQALTPAQAAAFNADIVDAPSVYYQSWAGVSRPMGQGRSELDRRAEELCASDDGDAYDAGRRDYMALPLAPFVDQVSLDKSMPHDGFVAVDSARWGHFRGCIPADHQEQLGQKNLPDVNVRTGLDIARFYASVASDLAKRGL